MDMFDAMLAKKLAGGGGGSVPDMTGATSETDGTHGLVPAPLAGDEGKFLKGDGTWSDVPTELPAVTSSDNGNVLTVANGEWVASGKGNHIFHAFEYSGGVVSFPDGATIESIINEIENGNFVILTNANRYYYLALFNKQYGVYCFTNTAMATTGKAASYYSVMYFNNNWSYMTKKFDLQNQ